MSGQAGQSPVPPSKEATRLTDQPVCPYCGHVRHDAWEIDFGPGLEGEAEITCGECLKDYEVSREVAVYYTTRAPMKRPI